MSIRSVFQESFIGHIIHSLSGRRWLKYPEENADFVLPSKYALRAKEASSTGASLSSAPRSNLDALRTDTVDSARTRFEDGELESQGQEVIIVDWYGPDDPENPQNWSLGKKCWLTFCIMLITTSVYIGSSIYAPAVPSAMEYFGVAQVPALLGISLFVLGYGIGPLFLSPITEVPKIGRTIPYIIPLALFAILQLPTALVTNFAGFCVLRFLSGFVSSPPLATGGASLFDIFRPEKFAYPMGLYDISAAAGPTLGPVVAAYAVYAKNWRWAFWELLWIAGFALLFLSCALPETSADNILYRRAIRLRRLTGNPNIKSQSEIDTAHLDFKAEILNAIVRPITMTFKEPIVLATDLYVGYVYALIYSYFESFPLVYEYGYGWSGANANLPYLAFIAGESFSVIGYVIWARLYWEPKFAETGGHPKPEASLPMGIPGGFFAPPTLFWFGWTAVRTHWISPVLASAVFGLGTSWMFMPFLTYLPLAYPKYAASALASNDFVRSLMGAGMPLAAAPLFHNLGIAWGNSLLGFIAILFVPVPWLLFAYGGKLRNKSPMALHDSDIEKMRQNSAA